MGIIRTDDWLEESFFEPERLCGNLEEHFNGLKGQDIYRFLQSKGMYKPNRLTKENFETMKKRGLWEKMEGIFRRYKKEWTGPDLPIYMFPSSFSLFDPHVKKQGFTFPDKMFLFLPPLLDEEELEAVFVHEYHHATRLNKLKKPVAENTLADSVVMEGLAEFAVLNCCGKRLLSKWVLAYDEREIERIWKKWFEPNISVKINDPLHDRLLYGSMFSKPMFGYAAGFHFVTRFDKRKKLLIKDTFTVPAKVLINNGGTGK